jgi:iron complex outermembrane receptor protein
LIFQPETSDSWEIGIKADLLDRRLRVNAAIYRTDYDDFQANTFVGTGFVLQNAGKITTTGGEVEIFAVPNEWLTLSSGIAWVDAEYDKFEGGPCIRTRLLNSPDAGQPFFPTVCNNSGNIVPSTPRVSFYVSAAVTKYFSNGLMGYSQLDLSWRDEVEAGTDNDPNKTQDSLALINLRIGLSFNEKYDISLWGKNLTDENYRTGTFNSVLREGSLSGFHSEPRTWGITLRGYY